jgi:DNA-binding Lrp family transcriptional regulator
VQDGDGDFTTSADRNLLRLIEHYGGPATPAEISRGLGISRSAAGSRAKLLAASGWLIVTGKGADREYEVSASGRGYLAANRVSYLLVQVDDRLAEDVAAILSQNFNGIEMVTDHGGGCCCQHCPHRGNCR